VSKALEVQLGGTLKLLVSEIEDVPQGSVIITLIYDKRFSVTAEVMQMAYTLPADKQVEVKVSYVDANGNPAVVDGDVAWSSSDTNIASVLADKDDSAHAIVIPQDEIGQVQIIATADADLGAGVRQLITTMDVTVVGGEAVAGTIEPVGAPAELPHPEPRTKGK
jgi:hypothetical protein